MENIKSKFIIKIILSYLDFKSKLEIIKYNKRIQNIININIYNYKILSGKYIEYIENKNIRRYDTYTEQLIFEGEYFNDKSELKGKEFGLYNKLIFEGEYLKGKKNGKGKEYYWNGVLKYEGEYLNGKRNGKGKEYDRNGVLLFEGEFNYNKKWKGIEYQYDLNGELVFEIEYLNGKKWTGKKKRRERLYIRI